MRESLVQHVTLSLSKLAGTGGPARKTPGSPQRAEETCQPVMTLVLINGVTEVTRALQERLEAEGKGFSGKVICRWDDELEQKLTGKKEGRGHFKESNRRAKI